MKTVLTVAIRYTHYIYTQIILPTGGPSNSGRLFPTCTICVFSCCGLFVPFNAPSCAKSPTAEQWVWAGGCGLGRYHAIALDDIDDLDINNAEK